MKRFIVFFLCCLLSLLLIACGGTADTTTASPDETSGTDTSPILAHVSIEELSSLKKGDTALLEAVITGKMGHKLYISDESGAYELIDLPSMLWLQCGIGQRMEFTVKATESGISATDAKRLSSGNTVPDAVSLASVSSLNEYLYQRINISGLTIVNIDGHLFDTECDVRITVSDGQNESVLLISSDLPTAERKAITTALNYPMAGDILNVSDAFVTVADGTVIDLGATTASIRVEGGAKINIERLEKDIADISLDVGETYRYLPTTSPADANNFAYVTYTVSNPDIASIDADGTIHGQSYGLTYLHVEQTGGNKIVIPLYVEPKLELGYDKWSPTKVDETPRPVSSLEELRTEFFEAALDGYREIYIKFNLTEPIRSTQIDRLNEYKYLATFPLATVIGGDSTDVYRNELVKFTFRGWEGETMYGPYEMPTAQSGVNFIDAATVLRQKYMIEKSPYKRGESFEDFPITKNNNGTIAVYNPSQLVWAMEYRLLPTFPLADSKAEYLYEQAKDILRRIVTDDMTEVQKCKAIFDYICQNAVYAVDYYDRTTPVDYYPPEQSVMGFFERGRVVCEGYAETFVLLAGIEGIEAYRVSGDLQANRMDGHMWNAVVLDGKWYEICATQSDNTMRGWPDNWFDEEAQGAGHDTHSYRHFLVDNAYFKEAYPYQNVPKDASFANVYDVHLIDKLPGKDFDYIIESSAELEKVLREVVSLGLKGNYYINLTFRGLEPSFDMLEPIMKRLGYKGEYTYTSPIESLNGKDRYYSITFHDVT